MPYTNYTKLLIEALRSILGVEFGSRPLIVLGEQHDAVERFEIALVRTEPADPYATRRGRIYVFRLDHVTSLQYKGEKQVYVRAEQAERLEELLDTNRSYRAGGVTLWHDLRIGVNDLQAETEEDLTAGAQRSSLEFSVYVDKLR